MELVNPGRGVVVAAIGGVLLVFALLALPWYDVGEPKIAPLQIDASGAPALLAQEDLAPSPGDEDTEPPTLEDVQFTEGSLPASFGAWSYGGTLATLANLIMLAAGLAALAVGTAAALGGRPDRTGKGLLALALAALLMVVLRMIFRPETFDLGTNNVPFEFEAGLESGILVALAAALILLVGATLRVLGPSGPPQEPRPTAR